MAGNVVSNVKKYYGGQVPVPGQGDSDGKVKMLVEKTATMEIEGVQTEVELLYDADDLTTPVTPQQLGQWTDENYLIAFKTKDDEGHVRGFVLYALSTESTSTDTLVNRAEFISFKGDMTEPGASAFEFTMVEDSSTLARYLRDENGELIVKFNQSCVEAGAQSGTLDNLIATDSTYMDFEVVHEGDNAYLNLNTESLDRELDALWEDITDIIDAIDELPSDEHGYFNSSLVQTPGDGTTENIVIDNFRISQGRDVHGESIEFVPTHQEGGVDFGEVYLEPGTYILAIQYTLQWVGNPRGTFLPKVCSVADQPFDFSYEHEDVIRVTRIVTRTTRGKLITNIAIDADTPSMGVWVKNMEVVQVASYNHPAVVHDTTLTGKGQLGDPLGVTPSAFGKVKDIPTSISQFRAGDVIPVDGPNGPAKMGKDDLLQNLPLEYLGLWQNLKSSQSNGKVIYTNGGIGSVVDYTETVAVGWSSLVLPCSKGDVFKIKGAGGASARLWCFVDTSDKIIDVAGSDETTAGEFVYRTALVNGKIIINVDTATGEAYRCNSVNNALKILENGTERLCSYYGNSLEKLMSNNNVIATNGGIGSIVDYTELFAVGMKNLVSACSQGDVFKIKGTGGASARLWCFVDSSDKIVDVAGAIESTGGEFIYKTAPVNGKLIINVDTATGKVYKRSSVHDNLENLKNGTDKLCSYYGNSLTDSMYRGKIIVTNGGIGSVVDYTEIVAVGWSCLVFPCSKGDVFKIKGTGGVSSRLWCFVDSSDKIVDVAGSDETTDGEFIYKTAPVNGKVIINVETATGEVYARNSVDYAFNLLNRRIDNVEKAEPMVVLDFDREPFDCTSLLQGFDFTDHLHYANNIYSLFDSLVSTSNGLVTSFDVGEYAGESYPAYCNTERIVCYRISRSSADYGNTRTFKKKKVLILGGVHGNEIAAPFNLYILAWRLVNDASKKDVFSLLSAFDFYFIPCVNLYGLRNNTRWNGNGVDLNRNNGTAGWTVREEPFDSTYTGPFADSEFETRCIHYCITHLEIDWLIDSHNYASEGQYYTETRDEKTFLTSYDTLKEISFLCVKNYPVYFGSKFIMVHAGEYGNSCPIGMSHTVGCFEGWANENGVVGCTIEINDRIGYNGGIPVNDFPGNDQFGSITFAIAEYTLRVQLVLYGENLL